MFTYEEIILAEVVLPQPGGPSKSTHFGLFVSFFILVFEVI